MPLNKERGEVALDLDGKVFVLCAEMARVAAWTNEVEITSLIELQQRLAQGDPKVVEAGVRNLCISPNADRLAATFLFRHQGPAIKALAEALTHGLEPAGPRQAKEKTAP